MFERNSRRVSSAATVNANDSSLNVGTDLNRDPVYLSGKVIPSTSFAQAMLALGAVITARECRSSKQSANLSGVS